jgi:putative transposase
MLDLRKLFHIHKVYEVKRARLQQKSSRNPSLLAKYFARRGRNRTRDFIHKLITFTTRISSLEA